MALASAASASGAGTYSVSITGISSSARSVLVQDSATGATVAVVNTGGTSSETVTNSTPHLGVATHAVVTVYSGTGATGTVLQNGTSNTVTPGLLGSTLSVLISGPDSGCSWSVYSNSNSKYVFSSVLVQYSIGGGALTTYGTFSTTTGSTGSSAVFVGYSTSVTWKITVNYTSATYGNYSPPTGQASGTTGAAPPSPPAAPNPITNLQATDNTTNIVLTWTASSGGANGYKVYRNGSLLSDVGSAVTKTDSTPPARPVTYTVYAYNTNAGGTTLASGVSITVNAGGTTAAGQTQQMVL